MPLKTVQIQEALLKHFYELRHHYCCTNFSGSGYCESDVFTIRGSMYVQEIEVKISRSDFKKDFTKTEKHLQLRNGKPANEYRKVPNQFYYASPTGLIKLDEVPEYAGLIYVEGYTLKDEQRVIYTVKIIKKAPMIHKIKVDQNVIMRMCQTLSARSIYGCALMTYKNRRNKQIFT